MGQCDVMSPSHFLRLFAGLLLLMSAADAIVLTPPNQNLALGRRISATHTCGEINGTAFQEMYCHIAGANPYTPHNQYSFKMTDEVKGFNHREDEHSDSFLKGGQNCDYCNATRRHPASNMVDGSPSWWMSPPLSRGLQYREVNITIDLEQEFHVAYVWIQMANSPRPGTWILEHSADYGKTYRPWQYFASSPAECHRVFGLASLSPINEDDDVICTSEFSSINQMENGEIMVNLLDNRPGKYNFTVSETLQNFVLATNVRIRLLRPKTLHDHFMDLYSGDLHSTTSDVTVTRRYYYAIKEIMMGGRCVCNGHAASCDVLDVSRPRALLCRCEHNTCGDKCERCCDGFVQKRWRRNHAYDQNFECEPCNCHGHSEQCEYDPELDAKGLSLDIHGNYAGGGRCRECRDNTAGINCNECRDGYYRPAGKKWNDTDVCQECVCDPSKHSGNCADETGACECLPKFAGPNCDICAEGYYHAPECRPCLCNVNGTENAQCLPSGGVCPCKPGYTGQYCEVCAPGFTNITAGCLACNCDENNSENQECNVETGQCSCKDRYGGLHCELCASNHYDYPACKFCDCDTSGTENEMCDQSSGQCLCKPGFSGRRCNACDKNYYGYPKCQPCNCDQHGSSSPACNSVTGECPCHANFTGRMCERCAVKYYSYPSCLPCDCDLFGAKGVTCNDAGECYCKPNFEGRRCEVCAANLFNYPICEECNCNPKGVIPEFAGCDKVAPGELCTCRENVMGHVCNECKPTFWDLQAEHPGGCIDCNCNKMGTLSMLNSCDKITGQCPCKLYADGLKCDRCAEGFFDMRADSQVGCRPCKCDPGGSVRKDCDAVTGQCHCKPRYQGLKCDQPIDQHYTPLLWHNRYEAEDGHSPDGKPVRYAIDRDQFPDFSWRGYAVFSPIQDEIILDVNVQKSALYNVIFHYKNPTQAPVDAELKFHSYQQNGNHIPDNEQKSKVTLEPGPIPADKFIQKDKDGPFVLTPGRWQLSIKSPKRLFLDYVVLLPAYYVGPDRGLTENAQEPCIKDATDGNACVELLYPPIPITTQVGPSNNFHSLDPTTGATSTLPTQPSNLGEAVIIETDDEHSREITVDVDVPQNSTYHIVVSYHNTDERARLPLRVRVEQGENPVAEGILLINRCPYTTFCEELLTASGQPLLLKLGESPPPAKIIFTVQPGRRFSVANVKLVNSTVWTPADIIPQVTCIRKNGVCVGQKYDVPPNSVTVEAESGQNVNRSISADKLPFPVDKPGEVAVMSLDSVQSTVEVEGIVPSPGEYVFVVQYFNPENPRTRTDVNVHGDFSDVFFDFCPSMTGCRTILTKKDGEKYYHVDEKYSITFFFNNTQKGPLYIDSVTAVSRAYYSDSILKPIPLDLSADYAYNCSAENFANLPSNVTDYCRGKIFTITGVFNGEALPCECNPKGSLTLNCAQYGGQCQCKPNVIGQKCTKCAPGYYNFPDCKKCECLLHQQCDELNGQCYCPRYVEGKSCDRCVRNAFGYDPLIGCQLCGCHPDGSHNGELECDALTGQCLCKENVGGRRCEKCLPGFYAFPRCLECACADSGTTDDVCDPKTSKCLCKKNVMGERCDSCRAGTFDLRKSDLGGCSDCFCFGVTDQCSSSMFPVQSISLDDQAWRSDDPAGRIEASQGRVVYYAPSDVEPSKLAQSVYLEAPIEVGGDYTASYGLHMSFIISSFPSSEKSSMNAAADVQVVSGATTLEYWAPEQPSNLSRPFKVVVTLFPEYWLLKSGEPASRAQLMSVLLKLEKVRIKASYYKRPAKVELEHFEIEMAAVNEPIPQSYLGNYVRASSVESCECPPPYTGPSCQRCAPGYYRVSATAVGSQLGSCVPCNCYGHSGTCDPDTGVCSDCQHHTMGDHCELCVEGFYGNATTGSPSSCLRCACPYPTETNNFAISCVVSEVGTLDRCVCRDGYSGNQCEVCQRGYFGRPTDHGAGECKRCFCNNNNDLMEEGACHPVSGDCALCTRNTDGRHCESCKEWYYGDAINAKNCTECSCDQCGSVDCDPVTGVCNCHPLVEGRNCDRCVENAWNFHSCRGCQMCECGIAASNSQCDAKTGQCACMPGASGKYCERCEDGFWDYGPQGCKKCDCEADLSMGTVCDVKTGQCHCQPGASGPRCDTCIENYLKVPKFGCRQCDECVYALNTELDAYDISVDILRSTLGNVSGIAVTGARLRRVQNSIAYLEPKIDNAITVESESNELTSVSTSAKALKDASANVEIRAERTAHQLDMLKAQMDESASRLMQLNSDIHDLIDTSKNVVRSVEELRNSFQNAAPVENEEPLVHTAEDNIKSIRENNNRSDIDLLHAKLETVQGTIDRINKLKQNSSAQLDSMNGEKDRLRHLIDTTNEFTSELQVVRSTIADVKKVLESLSLFPLRALLTGIEKDELEMMRVVKVCNETHANVTRLVSTLKEFEDSLKAKLVELNELKDRLLTESSNSQTRMRRQITNKESVDKKVEDLEQQFNRIAGIYDAAKLEASDAVNAAKAYKDVSETMMKAKNASETAQIEAAIALKISKGQRNQSRTARRQSDEIARRVHDLDQSVIVSLRNQHSALQARVDEIMPKLEKTVSEFKELNVSAITGGNKHTELDNILDTSDNAHSNLMPLNDKFAELQPKIEEAEKRVKELIVSNVEQSLSTADNQLKEVQKAIPESKVDWETAKIKLSNTSSLVEECKSRVALLKEKIAAARDKVNRLKLAAHFEAGSFLELPPPQSADDFGFFTEIELFFRTHALNGVLLYFGSETPQFGGEFVAIELENGRPKMTLNFGREPITAHLNEPVSDLLWRKIIVQRVGKQAYIRITKPQTESQYAAEKTVTAPGTRTVLNLFDDSLKLFIGGLPADFKRPTSIRQQSFVGDLDRLQLNGDLIGFWNNDHVHNVQGAVMRQLSEEERQTESAVSFNGQGYMRFSVNNWDPRKHTTLLFSFLTFSPDGLLFFIGKDRDQMIIELVDGHVSLYFDLGSGPARLKSVGGNYNDGKWHMVQVQRTEKRAKLEIDGGHDMNEGESPGETFEMTISDSFFIGGLPQNIKTRFAVQPFRGCIKNLKLDRDYVTLNHAKETKGVQNHCPKKEARVASLVSERAFAKFEFSHAAESDDHQIELALRFKSVQTSAQLVVAAISEEVILKLSLADGWLIVQASESDAEKAIRMKLDVQLAGNWHYVTVVRGTKSLKVHVDDIYTSETEATDISGIIQSEAASLIFGSTGSSSGGFIGCIGDVIYNGHLLGFDKSELNEVKLMGCMLNSNDFLSAATTPSSTDVEEESSVSTPASSIFKPAIQQSHVRPKGSCALMEEPRGQREDSGGIRFGLVPGSRLEFKRLPESFVEHSVVFSVQIRATADNGIIKFVANEKHSDFMTLYLQDGKIHFAFGSGNTKVFVHGKQSVLDGEWHVIKAEREGTVAALFIDGRLEVENRTEGTEVIDAQPPFYIGGLPNDLVPFAAKVIPGVKSEFGGCLRDFKLNDKKFDDTGNEVGTVPCSSLFENGIFFQKEGGYAVINPQFTIGHSFSIELEIKPRTKNAVLLSVGALHFLTLQILNGTIKFSVDTGAGVESVVRELPAPNQICDGHWHQIKLYKKKNIITLNVDGKSNLNIIKKKSVTENTTKDPLYLGGVPKDVKLKGLDTFDPYIGCVRILSLGKRTRKRQASPPVDLSDMVLFGAVSVDKCPSN